MKKLFHWCFKRETTILKTFSIIGFGVIAFFMLTGCATHALPFVTPPGNFACVFVQWTEESQIQNYCSPGAGACGTVAQAPNTIWTPKPQAFDDYERVYKLGHEFLHNLGARHK